jgi:hypothetical protein
VPKKKTGEFLLLLFAPPISGVRIAAPVVLAQHKGHNFTQKNRKSEETYCMCCALPILTDLAYKWGNLGGNGNMQRWACLLKQQTLITVYRLPTKVSKLTFSVCRQQTEVAVFR